MDEKLSLIRKAATSNFWFFLSHVLKMGPGFDLIEEQPHKWMCEVASTWGSDRIKDILTPRDSYKTTVLNVAYALWEIVRDPNITILLTSYSYANSIKTLQAIRSVIENHTMFRNVFGDLKSEAMWSKTEILVNTRTTTNRASTITISGVTASATGQHYKLILFDDPHDVHNVTTPEQIQKVVRYFYELQNIMDAESGRMMITATRWAYNDIHSLLLTMPGIEKHVRAAEWDDNGVMKYFFPRRLGPETLRRKKTTTDAWTYSCQYMNDPRDNETCLFKKEYFKYCTYSPQTRTICVLDNFGIPSQDRTTLDKCKTYILVDPAGSDGVSATRKLDYSAMVVVAVDDSGRWFVLEVVAEKNMPPSAIIAKLLDLSDTYKPYLVGIEGVTYAGQLQEGLERELRSRGLAIPVHDLSPRNRTKKMRVQALEPLYRSGVVHHVKGLFDLEDQLSRWRMGMSMHDDVCDALAYLLDLVDPPSSRMESEHNPLSGITDYARIPGIVASATIEYQAQGRLNTGYSFQEFLSSYVPPTEVVNDFL